MSFSYNHQKPWLNLRTRVLSIMNPSCILRTIRPDRSISLEQFQNSYWSSFMLFCTSFWWLLPFSSILSVQQFSSCVGKAAKFRSHCIALCMWSLQRQGRRNLWGHWAWSQQYFCIFYSNQGKQIMHTK